MCFKQWLEFAVKSLKCLSDKYLFLFTCEVLKNNSEQTLLVVLNLNYVFVEFAENRKLFK